MNTKSLVLILVALLAFAGNAIAQKDITSSYITNATLSNGTTGWTTACTKTTTTTDPADAFSNSVQGNNTTGYASEAYAGWGSLIQTAYSMKQTITLPKGSYRLVNYSFFRQGQAYNTDAEKSLAYLVAGENKVVLKTLGSITAAGYANSQAEGANCFDSKMYRNVVEFEIAADNTQIAIGIEGTFDEARSWCIVGMFELFDLNDAASVSSPTDVTYAITNSGFEYRDMTGWTLSESGAFGTQNNNSSEIKAGGYYAEKWQTSGGLSDRTMTQTLSDLPDGLYELSAYVRYGGTGAFIQLNDIKTEVNANSFSTPYTVRTTINDGNLTIQAGLKNGTSNWVCFDRFSLKFYGDPLQAYKDLLAEKVAEAQALVDGGTLKTGAANVLQTVINDNDNDDDAFTEESQFNTAVQNIENAISKANETVAAYALYDAFKAKVVTLEASMSDDDKTSFESVIAEIDESVTIASSAAAVNEQILLLRSTALDFIASHDGQFDITFLASQVYSDWKKSDGTAAGIVADQFLTGRPSDIPSFAESYESTCVTTGDVLYQTVSNLPVGYYQVGMYAQALYTSGRGFETEATEGDSNRSFAFAGNQRTGLPIKFGTEVAFADLTTLDVNVHLSEAGDLTFGVTKDANGSNWHFAQIASIVYSNSPDLTSLKATRDALVAEAEGLLSGSSVYLTEDQKTALQSAINAGKAADVFDELNTVTLTTLPNAINTANQQVQQVTENRALMLAALERFENDYNLVDGTDYRRVTMSADAWAKLIEKVNAVSEALDDVSQSASYGTIKDALVAQLDATDASIRLFKSYKAMVDGTSALNISESATYEADSYMDTDGTEQTAIEALNTAFGTYAESQQENFDVAGFLGDNLDFSADQGTEELSGVTNASIYDIDGWEESYSNIDNWSVIQNQNSSYAGQLYLRSNWNSQAVTLKVFKQKMLPVGKYQLTLSWNSDLANMTNLSAYVIGSTSTAIGEATSEAKTLTYDFEITETPQPFDLIFGFVKTGTGNTPAQILVDDIVLTAIVDNVLIGDVNRDGSVTIADVTALVNIILGKVEEGAYDLSAADVNADDSITIADVTALVNIILGKKSE